MNAASHHLEFKGRVRCVAGPSPTGLTLLGMLEASPAELSLICLDATTLPDSFDGLSFETLTAPLIRLTSGTQEWRLAVRTWQLHRDVGASFYQAIPPRTTPWKRRFTWGVLLGVAGTPFGRWLLSRR